MVVYRAGRQRTCTKDNIPPDVASALASLWLKSGPNLGLALGAFHAMDQYGDRKLARRYWQQSAAGRELLPEIVRQAEAMLGEAERAGNAEAMKLALRVAMTGARAAKDFRHLRELEEIEKRIPASSSSSPATPQTTPPRPPDLQSGGGSF